jgi:NAD(P)H-hydrate epimerase
MDLVTAAEMQAMDRLTIAEFGLPGRILMENAGRGAVDVLFRRFDNLAGQRIGVAAGRGNNGGDGFVMARYLFQSGLNVTVFLLAERAKVAGDAGANLALLDLLSVPVVCIPDAQALDACRQEISRIGLWIDAIFGTGLNSDIRGHYAEMIGFINAAARPVLAVDIASGLNTDNGQICGAAVKADATATFAFAKIGHWVYPGAALTGKLDVIDIGIPPYIAERVAPAQSLITPALARQGLRLRPADAHKGIAGHVLVVAGSPGKAGAAAMTAMAAMRAGAGLVTLAAPVGIHAVLETLVLEAMTAALAETSDGVLAGQAYPALIQLLVGKRCLAIGPGLGTAPETGELVRQLAAECPIPLVMDADALNLLAGDLSPLARRRAPCVLTPHPGEMARLLNLPTADIQKDRLSAARRLAQSSGACVVLKGAATVVADPDGRVMINPTGNSGMAAGGMGDVLTGVIAGLIAQGAGPFEAAICGVFLHGSAADDLAKNVGPRGYLASDVMAALPKMIADVLSDLPGPANRSA